MCDKVQEKSSTHNTLGGEPVGLIVEEATGAEELVSIEKD